MKLHLPTPFRSALLACLSSVGVLNTSLGTAVLATGLVAYAMTATQAETLTLTTRYDSGPELSEYNGYNEVVYHALNYSYQNDYSFCGGGAIFNKVNTFSLSGNKTVTFSDNFYYASRSDGHGGAICNGNKDAGTYATFTLFGNEDVTFSGNYVSCDYDAQGGAIYNSCIFSLSGNESTVNFSGNSAQGETVSGGAIYNSGTFTQSGNRDVTFRGNFTSCLASLGSGDGGAIFNRGTFSLNDNETVTFSENAASHGGAIFNSVGPFSLSGNMAVTFSGNRTFGLADRTGVSPYSGGGAIFNSNTFSLSENVNVTFCGNTSYFHQTEDYPSVANRTAGGAIYNYFGTFSLCDNETVTFRENKVLDFGVGNSYYYLGGAIYNNDGTFELSGNRSVMFNGNTAAYSGSSYYVYGGAIYSAVYTGTFSLCDNDAVIFSENTASGSSSAGGAIYSDGTFSLCGNAAVTFNGNTASGTSRAEGGAIYNLNRAGTFSLSGNAAVTFSGNTASGSSSAGGAIYSGGTFSLCDNDAVIFSENTASSGGAIYSGAIYSDGTFSLCGNAAVTFSGNAASGRSSAEGGAIYNRFGTFSLSDNAAVSFSKNTTSGGDSAGGAIYNSYGTFSLSGNDAVTFSENTLSGSSSAAGGAIYNSSGTFSLSGNDAVTFSENTLSGSSSAAGGAIYNSSGTFSLSGNDAVTFSENTLSGSSSAAGGAICSGGTFSLCGNGAITFIGNTVNATVTSFDNATSRGGAIRSYDTFTLSGNGDVTFIGNMASASSASRTAASSLGGAICNSGSFTLSGNGNVLFEKNAEVSNGTYRLRSIYSAQTSAYGSAPVLNLSASENHSITFRDSVYASGTVNLNAEGTGDIIFTGVSTEADLREVKGGVAGKASEIRNSRTSEFVTEATLYGGRLIVEKGAILRGQGIYVEQDANATIRLNGATLDEAGYDIYISEGSGLELEGENVLNAASVQLEDGAKLSFVMGEGKGTTWNAEIFAEQLTVQVSGDLFSEHRLLTLADAAQFDTTLWTSDTISVKGTSFESLSWNAGVLTYTPNVIAVAADGVLDMMLPGDGTAIIEGGGHTLSANAEVQLVQMALKDCAVKLEGANNGIDTVTLVEGGELVLAAGAGLTTGDIISMEASGKDEMVISGDITLDDKGMKGKAGAQATVSHADAQVLGDATISNVSVEDSTIDLAEGSTVGFEHVVLAATTRITDDPATANLDDVTAELVMGVNTSMTGSDLLLTGTTLVQSGNTGVALTLSDDASVLMLEATTFDSLTLSGSSLVLELAGMTLEMFDNAELIAVSFTSGTNYATYDKSLAVTLSVDGINYERGYTMESDDTPTTMYFRSGKKSAATPEPATATLSLLALAALAARRKRK